MPVEVVVTGMVVVITFLNFVTLIDYWAGEAFRPLGLGVETATKHGSALAAALLHLGGTALCRRTPPCRRPLVRSPGVRERAAVAAVGSGAPIVRHSSLRHGGGVDCTGSAVLLGGTG